MFVSVPIDNVKYFLISNGYSDTLNHLDDNMNVFDLLPSDILIKIIDSLDYETIILCGMISRKFNIFYNNNLELLRNHLSAICRFNISGYDSVKLVNLAKILSNKVCAMSNSSSSFVKIFGKVHVFGDNKRGNLGLGHKVYDKYDYIYEYDYDQIKVSGAHFLPVLNSKLDNLNIKQIVVSEQHSLILTTDGRVYTSLQHKGNNEKSTHRLIPELIDIVFISVSAAITNCGKMYIIKLERGHINCELVPDLYDIISVSHLNTRGITVVLTKYGQVYALECLVVISQLNGIDFELDSKCSLIIIPQLNNIAHIACSHDRLFAITNNYEVYSVSSYYCTMLGYYRFDLTPTLIPELNNIIMISATYHVLALTNDGKVWVYEDNICGQLGLGDNGPRCAPTIIPGLDNIISIAAGNEYSLMISSDKKVYGCGRNNLGQLGLGDNKDRNIPTLIKF